MDEHESNTEPNPFEVTRRTVIETGTTALLLATLPRAALAGPVDDNEPPPPAVKVELQINGHPHSLTLAVMHDGQSVTTIEGLAEGDHLHPLQAAFVEHDGFQCGYCTSGQICSAIGMLAESRQGMPSYVTEDLTHPAAELTDVEIRERMSGNICRCAAYPNIVAAIKQAAGTPA
jgi:xanthine dehydrogenase YagT iron-sulfur-binding subunit